MEKIRASIGAIPNQVLRFFASTILSAAMSFGIPVLLVEIFHLHKPVAVALGFGTAYLANLLLLRRFVFQSTNRWSRDVLGYVLTNGCFRVLEYVSFLLLLKMFGVQYLISLLLILGTSSIVKFFAYRVIFTTQS